MANHLTVKGIRYSFNTQIVNVPIAKPERVNSKLDIYIKKIMEEYSKFDKIIGYADCSLEARFKCIRTE